MLTPKPVKQDSDIPTHKRLMEYLTYTGNKPDHIPEWYIKVRDRDMSNWEKNENRWILPHVGDSRPHVVDSRPHVVDFRPHVGVLKTHTNSVLRASKKKPRVNKKQKTKYLKQKNTIYRKK